MEERRVIVMVSIRHPIPRRPAAFTLVELLVVIAVIGLLLAMLLPALAAVLDSVRATQCKNNLRQIGVALRGYHQTHDCFPASNYAATAGVCMGNTAFANSEDLANWAIALLPFLELDTIYSQYNHEAFNEDRSNQLVQTAEVALYRCPADRNAGRLHVPAMGPAASWALNTPYRSGSYRAISGRSDGLNFLDDTLLQTYPEEWRGVMHLVGVLGFHHERDRDVKDGLSHTLAVGESTTTTQPEFGTFWSYSFSFYSVAAVTPQRRILRGNYEACRMAPGQGSSLPCRRGFGSDHSGGIHFLMADGTMQNFSRDMDMNLLAALATIDGGEQLVD